MDKLCVQGEPMVYMNYVFKVNT